MVGEVDVQPGGVSNPNGDSVILLATEITAAKRKEFEQLPYVRIATSVDQAFDLYFALKTIIHAADATSWPKDDDRQLLPKYTELSGTTKQRTSRARMAAPARRIKRERVSPRTRCAIAKVLPRCSPTEPLLLHPRGRHRPG